MKLNIKIPSNPYAVSLISALVTFIVYLPSLMNDFVTWDDNLYIYDNEHIKSLSLDLVKWSLSDFHSGNWHPLTWVSHAFDYAVWGMNPSGHHLTSVLFHALNTFLVTLLAVRLIETYRTSKDHEDQGFSMSHTSVLLAGIVTGLLFGLHPLHVESVAWISERKDVLYSFFFLLALLEYIRYVSELEVSDPASGIYGGVRSKYFSVFFLFIFAVISKPMAVTFPAILLILDWFPLRRLQTAAGRRRAVLEKIPFFVTTMVLTGMAFIAQKTAHAVAERLPIPLFVRIMNAFKAIIDYLINMAWPVDLMPLYPHPYWENPVATSPQYTIPALIFVGITACCITLIKRQKMWLATWASYVFMLFPVLGIIQLGAQGMADRYTYLPSVGPFLIIGIVAGSVRERIVASDVSKTAWATGIAAFCIVIVLLSSATIKQIHVWKNGVTLWSHEIDTLKKKSSTNVFAFWTAYGGLGYAHMRKENYESAINDFSEVILLKPDDIGAYQQRGIAHARLGRIEDAIRDFSSAISINSDMPQLYYNRGTAFARQGSFEKTVQDMTKAISISKKPRAEYYLNRGLALKKLGRLKEGERDITEASKLRNAKSEEMKISTDRGSL